MKTEKPKEEKVDMAATGITDQAECASSTALAKVIKLNAQILPIPEALYGCSNDWCATEHSFPPDDLSWYHEGQRWVCDYC